MIVTDKGRKRGGGWGLGVGGEMARRTAGRINGWTIEWKKGGEGGRQYLFIEWFVGCFVADPFLSSAFHSQTQVMT